MNLRTPSREFEVSGVGVAGLEDHSCGCEQEVTPRRRSLRLAKPIPYGWTLGPLLLLGTWAMGSALGLIDPRSLPAPWTVVTTAVDLVHDGRLQDSLLISLQRVVEGFALGVLAGIVFALASGLSRIGEYLIDGVVQFKRAIPTLALIPLLMLYLGIGEGMKVAIIALSAFIPVYINLHSYLRALDSRYVELAETLRLNYGTFVRHVVLPGALPGLFLGLRLGVTAAWIALVVVEQINATSGIGYMIYLAGTYGQINIVLVGLVVYGILGFASDAAIRFVQKKALSWQRTLEN
jgi:sulfonate transport system permease protein